MKNLKVLALILGILFLTISIILVNFNKPFGNLFLALSSLIIFISILLLFWET